MSARKALPTALALGLTLAAGAHADEGMWMPTQLPDLAKPLQAAGFKGNPADLANVTAPPLSAVVRAGGGTGSFVSADGLLLTNHHVAMGVIQYNSSPEHDLINRGFIAKGRADERPANPDFRVLVTVGFDKVTDQVLAQARARPAVPTSMPWMRPASRSWPSARRTAACAARWPTCTTAPTSTASPSWN